VDNNRSLPFVQREPRVAVHCACAVIEADGSEVPATLVNISSKGFGLVSESELVADEARRLRIHKSIEHRVRLIWTRGREGGGRFLDEAALVA